jgi:DNA repair photolyase
VSLVTKNALVLRDLDILQELAKLNLVNVYISVTSLDPALSQILEPRASAPHRRLRAIETLSAAGVPVGAMLAPLIPFVNDDEMEAIVGEVAQAGAVAAVYTLLRLPHEVKDLFRDWLQQHLPLRAERVMAAVAQARGGRDYDPRFGIRMVGEGNMAELLRQRFALAIRKHGLNRARQPLRTDLFIAPERPRKEKDEKQFSLF